MLLSMDQNNIARAVPPPFRRLISKEIRSSTLLLRSSNCPSDRRGIQLRRTYGRRTVIEEIDYGVGRRL